VTVAQEHALACRRPLPDGKPGSPWWIGRGTKPHAVWTIGAERALVGANPRGTPETTSPPGNRLSRQAGKGREPTQEGPAQAGGADYRLLVSVIPLWYEQRRERLRAVILRVPDERQVKSRLDRF